MANCFLLIISSVDGYKIIKTAYSLRVGDFGFSPKSIPSVVAGNQFLQFGCISPDTGIFPSQRMQDIQASA